MKQEMGYGLDDDISQVYFTGDICEDCVYQNDCVLLAAISSNMVTLNNNQALEYCCFYDMQELFKESETNECDT